jgi:hypothetical protein
MSEKRFTPGPWEIEPEDHISMGPCVTADGNRSDGWIICDLSLPTSLVGISSEDLNAEVIAERDANADLIAAAPDAVALAEAVLDESDQPHLREMARFWLAKARGEA